MTYTVANTTANSRSAVAAKRAGLKRYNGSVCTKHPELNGERNARNRGCVGCNKEKMRIRRAANPEFYKAIVRAAYLKNRVKYLAKSAIRGRFRRSGIDENAYSRLLQIQGGKCPVCSRDLASNRPHADHCHDTKQPRGILCAVCNQAEGMIRHLGISAYEFGKRLTDYLSNPPARKLDQ